METWLDLNTQNLLGRVDSRIDINALVLDVISKYDLGKLIRFRRIHEGFEDYNIRLVTSSGIYLLKLFSQYKSFRHVKDNINGILEFVSLGVRTPKLYPTKDEDYLYTYENPESGAMALGCLLEYFPSKSFFKLRSGIEIATMVDIVNDMTKIHGAKFKPKGIYDVWSVENLAIEYSKKKRFVPSSERRYIDNVVEEFHGLDMLKLKKAVIHGDLQRSNILRNKKGEIKIIDFSVMSVSAVSIDLAVYIALFCINPLEDGVNKIREIYDRVISKYMDQRNLTRHDISAIPTLINAVYAINYLAATYEKFGKGDMGEEVAYWIELGLEGMKQFKKWKLG